MQLDPRVANSVFHVCVRVRDGERRVVKYPRLDNWFAKSFFDQLPASGGGSRFMSVIASLSSDPFVGIHIARVYDFDRFGGNVSEYVEGQNLMVLRAHILEHLALPASVRAGPVRRAIQQLRENLRIHRERGGARIGDWDLQNLIHEDASGVIKNVDHGGFVSYKSGERQSSDAFIDYRLGGLDAVLELVESSRPEDRETLSALAAVWKTTASGTMYNGGAYIAGYHSLEVGGRFFRGQRDCRARLASVPFDFAGKVVVDVGCNAGGMLHSLAGVIREGIGVDRDSRCINAATLVSAVNGTGNLRFHTFDLERDELEHLRVLTRGRRIDICFMLSVAMWISNWREVVAFMSTLADVMLFETNGSPSQQAEQMAHLQKCFGDVRQLQENSPDDAHQRNRALYLCAGPAVLQRQVPAEARATAGTPAPSATGGSNRLVTAAVAALRAPAV